MLASGFFSPYFYKNHSVSQLNGKPMAGIHKEEKNTDNMILDGNIFWKQVTNQYLKKFLYLLPTCRHIHILIAK